MRLEVRVFVKMSVRRIERGEVGEGIEEGGDGAKEEAPNQKKKNSNQCKSMRFRLTFSFFGFFFL